MNDQWTDRLSEYVDGELTPAERDAIESHIAGCAECRGTLADVRAVVARAQSLENRPPAADLWPGIRAQLTTGRQLSAVSSQPRGRRGLVLSVPQLLAASVALALVSGGAVWMATSDARTDRPGDVVFQPVPERTTQVDYVPPAWGDRAVAQLEDALARNEGRLDTATVRVVRQSLATIDRAIAQAQWALGRDPNSAYLKLHLANTMRQKIELLRRANALAAGES